MAKLTDEDLAELERTYGPAEQQRCAECGGELVFAASMGSLQKYVCGSPEASIVQHPIGKRGWQTALNHYHASEWFDQGKADPRIARLIQEVRESRLPGHEQLDLVEVETAQNILQGVYAAVAAVMPPPIDEPGFAARYHQMVLEAIQGQMRPWDTTPEKGTPA